MKYKYSIIIPIYNVEKYLKQCIESILKQTYNNYEIILVDDGTPDKAGVICDEYSDKYQFIKSIHKKNGGLSDARNVGLKNAIGEYIIFLDSDDFWLEVDFLKNISEILNNNDILIFNSIKYFNEKKQTKPRFKLTDDFNALNNKEKKEYIIKNNIYKACAWDKVIKKSILTNNKISFPLGFKSEDMIWGANLLDNIESIVIYENPVYAYRQREESISKTVSESHIDNIIEQLKIKFDNDLIYNYFAYEYTVLLAYSYCSSKAQKKKIKNMDYLLKYDLSDKVKKVRKLYNAFGFNLTCKILHLYIAIKSK